MSKRVITGWVLSVLITLFLVVVSGIPKFVEFEGKEKMFADMGWDVETVKYIGVIEIALAILLLIPRAAFMAAVLLTAYYGGATATHVRVYEPFFFPILFGVLTWVAVGLRDPRVFENAFKSPRRELVG